MNPKNEVTLSTIAGGAADERFALEFSRVLANIADPNTKPKAKRSITLTLTFTPTEGRDAMTVELDVRKKLAPLAAVSELAFISRNRDGTPRATRHDARQAEIDFVEEVAAEAGAAPDDADDAVTSIDNARNRKVN